MSGVQKIRYGRFNVLVAPEGGRFTAKIELAVTHEQIGQPVVGSTIDEALMKAKLEALRIEHHEAEDAFA